VSFRLEELRWYHLVGLWVLGCAALLAMIRIFPGENGVDVIVAIPMRLGDIVDTVAAVWSHWPAFAIVLVGLPTFTIAMLVWGVVRALGHR
jgi:multisubunit Na+/H+ antiporter MnhF subunit